jgi:hypothetical protein
MLPGRINDTECSRGSMAKQGVRSIVGRRRSGGAHREHSREERKIVKFHALFDFFVMDAFVL